jgi:hypothetical protein
VFPSLTVGFLSATATSLFLPQTITLTLTLTHPEGIANPSATAVSVTVTDISSGESYTVQADKLGPTATHQPVGPEFAGMHNNIPGPPPRFAVVSSFGRHWWGMIGEAMRVVIVIV